MAEDLSDLLGEPAPELTPSRALQRRSRSVVTNPFRTKNTPERMRRLLSAASEMPVTGDACMRVGISVSALKYWLKKSEEGAPGDGFDVSIADDEPSVRFHEAWYAAIELGVDRVEAAMIQKALGMREPQVFQGRVVYRHDPDLVRLNGGVQSMDTYLLDANGEPVPESVMKQDSDLMQFILKGRRSKVYGNKATVDMNIRGGVLVVGAVAKSAADVTVEEAAYKADAVDVEFDEVSEDEV